MAKKKFYIWLENETAEAFRKRSIAEGKTLSETGELLIQTAMSETGSREETPSVSSPSFDLSGIKKAVDQAMEASSIDIKKAILSLRSEIEKTPVSGSKNSDSWTKEAIETQLNLTARIYSLMMFLSMKADAGGHPDRIKISNREGERTAQKLGFFTEKEI